MPESGDVDEAIRAVQGGDLEAYETVVLAESAFLRSWLAARCPPGLEADELAHQAFIKAYQHLHAYEPGTNFRAWLCRIAYHLLLAACKQLRRRDRVEVKGLELELLERRCRTLEADGEGDWLRADLLRRCLAELGEPARKLIELRYRHGSSVTEIAASLDRSPNAISKNLSLVRKRLRECIVHRLVGQGMP